MTEQEYYELPYGAGDRMYLQNDMIWDALVPKFKQELQNTEIVNSNDLSFMPYLERTKK